MPSHPLIDTHLAELGRRLPASAADELADGFAETYQHHLDGGLDQGAAAAAAIAEFGGVEQITAAFTRQAPGQRAARILLATGPAVGVAWGTSLLVGHAWTWPVPVPIRLAFALALLAVVAILATAASSRHSLARTRLAYLGALGLVALDTAMLAGVLLTAPALVWPMAVAIPASLARVGLTVRCLPRILLA